MDRDEQIQSAKRQYMREYMREYRKKNKQKIKEYTDNYWLSRASLEVRSLSELERELTDLKQKV